MPQLKNVSTMSFDEFATSLTRTAKVAPHCRRRRLSLDKQQITESAPHFFVNGFSRT